MNTDATTQPQWQPSLSASPGGAVMVTWYDRRNTTNGTNYQYWGRVSTDNGATWLADDTVSDVMITQPVQPDPNVQSCYAGDYNYQSMVGNTALITWTDGRGTGNNQDVQFDRAAAPIATATPSRTPTIPVTPTRTNTHTPTRTPTIPATPTRTITPTITDTPTPAACGNYVISSKATATIVPGTTDTGNHCDDCTSTIALPFPVSFYDQQFNTATVSSNGVLEFLSNNSSFTNICLPDITRDYAIFPHWDDQRTDTGFAGCAAYPNGCGIFTVVTGTVGSRTFAIEWQAVYFDNNAQVANYEVVFHEGSNTFDIIYGQVDQGGSSATVGAQRDSGSFYTQYECSTGGLTFGLHLHFVRPPCAGCVGDYTADRLNGVPMVQGTIDIGNHTDDGLTTIGLPFAYTFYDQTFTTASISTNGNLQFVSANSAFSNVCLPDPTMNYAIFPHWDDLRTDAQGGCSAYASGCGIFTSVTGSAPNRVFNIEWRAVYFSAVTQAVNFEVRLFEGVNYFEVIYGTNTQGGSSATVGSQMGTGAHYTPYSCNTGGLVAGTLLTFNLICRAVTPTPTSTVISTPTNTATNTPTNTPVPATPILDGHVNWQGRPAQPNALQVLPITLTLKLGAVERNYASQNTDQNGHFLSDVSGLANGTYNWRVKGPKYLANCGAVTLTGVPLTLAEMGLMRAGDANNDNIINIQDFNIVKTTFGKGNGDPGYDDRGDFTGDQIVNILDFNLQKQNFGTAGCNALLPLETR
jgi:hypothetical protein